MTEFRLATFNMENMFERPSAMNLPTWADGRPALNDHAELNSLMNKAAYSAADKARMLELLKRNGLDRDDNGDYLVLRQIRGHFIKRPRKRLPEIVASGRSDWIGWVDLQKEPIKELATENTARVFKEVGADIFGVVEAENRVQLQHFNDQLFPLVRAKAYAHVMLIDGNDDRGIDVGIMTGKGFDILSVRSHVDDRDSAGNRIFSRDCPEYQIAVPGGETIWVLVNHLKSKGYGSTPISNRRRKTQATRVREIYDTHRRAGHKLVAVIGDFNDTPQSDPLSPLLEKGSDLRDISESPKYKSDGRPGTWGNGTASGKIDYILLSPALFASVKQGGVMRKGVWGGKNGTLWEHFHMDTEKDAASDHAALWAVVAT